MPSRYNTISIGINSTEKYSDFFKERNVNFIRQYFTPRLRHLTSGEISQLNIISHVINIGDRYSKLSEKYYGDPTLWWLIAWFNRKPTDAHLRVGAVVEIPLPLNKYISFLGL